MGVRKNKREQLLLEDKSVVRVFSSIDFDKEIGIREKALEIEKKLKNLFPKPAIIGPVGDEEPEAVPRFFLEGEHTRCYFSQVRMEYHTAYTEQEGKPIDMRLDEMKYKTLKVFSSFRQETGKKLKRMGVVSDVVVPLRKGDNAISYLQKTFFRFTFSKPFTALDFHLAREHKDTYNINIYIKAQIKRTDPSKHVLYITVDVNDYLDQIKKKHTSYPNKEIERVFNFQKEIVVKNLDKILTNKFIL